MKKAISFVLVLMAILSICAISPTTAEASTTAVHANLSGRMPIVTVAMPISGASRVHPYDGPALRTRNTSLWIDSFSDQIVLREFSSNGMAVLVSYPSTAVGVRTVWFATADIIGLSSVGILAYTATASHNIFRMQSANAVASYGAIYNNDSCIRLGSRSVGSTTYYPTVYPISSTSLLGISGIRNKLGLTTHSGGATAVPPVQTQERAAYVSTQSANLNVRQSASTSAAIVGQFTTRQQITVLSASPENGFYRVRGTNAGTNNTITGFASAEYISFSVPNTTITRAQSIGYPVRNPGLNNCVTYFISGSSGARFSSFFNPRHMAWDYGNRCGTDILSIADGRVKRTTTASNGDRIIVVESVDRNGVTFYTRYSHLARIDVRENDTVRVGQQIGVMGSTGNAGGFVHLHIMVYTGSYVDHPGQMSRDYNSNAGNVVITKGVTSGGHTLYSVEEFIRRQQIW